MNVPEFIRALAILYFIAGFIGTFLILDPLPEPEEAITANQILLAAPAGSEENKTDAATQHPPGAHHEGEEKKSAYELIMQILMAFQNPIFFRLMTIKVICTIGFFFFAFSFKAICLKHMPNADRFVTFAANVTIIPNILSRLVGGIFYNKFKLTISQSTVSFLLCISVVLLVPCAASRSYTLFLGVLCIHYLSFGFGFTMHMMVFEDAFDKLGVLWLSISIVMTLALASIGFYLYEYLLGKVFSELVLTLIMGAFVLVPLIFVPTVANFIQEKNEREESELAACTNKETLENQ